MANNCRISVSRSVRRLSSFSLLRLCRPCDESFDDLPGDRRGEEGIPGCHDPDGVNELFGRRVLEQESAGSGAQRVEDVLISLEGGEDDDPTGDARSCTIRLVASSPSIVGIWTSMSTTSGRSRRVAATPCSPSPASPTISMSSSDFEDHLEPGSDQGLIVDQDDADAHAASLFSGNVACTANPPSGRGPALRWPPWRAARSRIPISPWPARVPWFRLAPRSVIEYFDLEVGRPVLESARGLSWLPNASEYWSVPLG